MRTSRLFGSDNQVRTSTFLFINPGSINVARWLEHLPLESRPQLQLSPFFTIELRLIAPQCRAFGVTMKGMQGACLLLLLVGFDPN